MFEQNSMNIGVALVLRDRFSNPARQVSSSINRLHNEAQTLVNANLQTTRAISGAIAAAGATMTYTMGRAIEQGAKYVDTMTFISSIAINTGKSMSDLSAKAKQVGLDTLFSAQDVASGMQYMAMAGQTSQEIYNNIAGATYLAGATMSEIGGKGGAADILTNIMKTFRIESSELASNKVADVLTRAVTRSNTNLYDLGEAIKYAGSTTHNLGASLEQTTAQIMVLGNAGIQASMAGTALSNAYRYLARAIGNPGTKGGKALDKLGLSKKDLTDANGGMLDLGDALSKISEAMDAKGLDEITKYNTFVDILGVRGQRAGAQMTQAFKDYGKFLKELEGSSGLAASVNEKRMAALGGALDQFKEGFLTMGIAFAEAVGPYLIPLMKAATEVMQGIISIMSTKGGGLVTALLAAAVVIGTIKAGVVFLRASFMLLFRESSVSFSNMASIMTGGWDAANMAATRYAGTVAGINGLTARQRYMSLQRLGDLTAVGKGPGNRALWTGNFGGVSGRDYYMNAATREGSGLYTRGVSSKGNPQIRYNNGLVQTFNPATQRYSYMAPTAQGGMGRISEKAAQGQISSMQRMIAVQMSKRDAGVAGIPGAKVSGSSSTGTVGMMSRIGSTMGKPLAAISKGIGSVVGFMFGPWGMLIQMLLIFGPSILSFVKGIFDNTNSISAEMKADLADERRRKMEQQGLTEEDVRNLTAQLVRQLMESQNANIKHVQLVVNVDGTTAARKEIDASNAKSNEVINAPNN